MMKLIAAHCGQHLFEIAFDFFWLRMFVLRKKNTSRMVEE
jgi:hypothetical protein